MATHGGGAASATHSPAAAASAAGRPWGATGGSGSGRGAGPASQRVSTSATRCPAVGGEDSTGVPWWCLTTSRCDDADPVRLSPSSDPPHPPAVITVGVEGGVPVDRRGRPRRWHHRHATRVGGRLPSAAGRRRAHSRRARVPRRKTGPAGPAPTGAVTASSQGPRAGSRTVPPGVPTSTPRDGPRGHVAYRAPQGHRRRLHPLVKVGGKAGGPPSRTSPG